MGDVQSVPKLSEKRIKIETLVNKTSTDFLKNQSLNGHQGCYRIKPRRGKKLLQYKPLSSNNLNFRIISKEESDQIVKARLTKAYLLNKLRAAINPKRNKEPDYQAKQVGQSIETQSKDIRSMKQDKTKPVSNPNSNRRRSLIIERKQELNNEKGFLKNEGIPLGTLKLDDSNNSLEELADTLNIDYKSSKDNTDIKTNLDKEQMINAESNRRESTANVVPNEDNNVRAKYSKFHVFVKAASEATSPRNEEIICLGSRRCYGQLPRKDANFGSVSHAVMQKPKPRKRSSFWGQPKLSLFLAQHTPSGSVATTPRAVDLKRGQTFLALAGPTQKNSSKKLGGSSTNVNNLQLIKHRKTSIGWGLSSGSLSTRSGSSGAEQHNPQSKVTPKEKSKFYLNK